MSRVVAGLSGGVDSAVTAYILKNEGHEVIGMTMINYGPDSSLIESESDNEKENLLWSEEAETASKIAEVLGIRHVVIDMRKEFRTNVMDYFTEEYKRGRTPNPCVMCNPLVKFEALMRVMKEQDCDYIATGHYAGVVKLDNGRYTIRKNNSEKDQTYALCRLTQEQLSHLLTPLAGLNKSEVRALAEEAGLFVADRKDSQDICFVQSGKYFDLMTDTDREGNFVDEDGNVLGKHLGISHYTVGQRKKLGLALNKPVFVKEIRPFTNEVVISTGGDVFFDDLFCDNCVCMEQEQFEDDVILNAKIRYAHEGTGCRVRNTGDGKMHVIFEKPVRAVTPGQAVVFYKDSLLYGSAIIC